MIRLSGSSNHNTFFCCVASEAREPSQTFRLDSQKPNTVQFVSLPDFIISYYFTIRTGKNADTKMSDLSGRHLSNNSLLSSLRLLPFRLSLELLSPISILPLTLRTSPAPPAPGCVSVLPGPARACRAPPGAGGTPRRRGARWCWQRAHTPSGSGARRRRFRWWTRPGSVPHTPPAASWCGPAEPPGRPSSAGREGCRTSCGEFSQWYFWCEQVLPPL